MAVGWRRSPGRSGLNFDDGMAADFDEVAEGEIEDAGADDSLGAAF